MDRLTFTQHIKIIKSYYKNIDHSHVSCLRGDYGLHNLPTKHNWQNCEQIRIDWSGYKNLKACSSPFR